MTGNAWWELLLQQHWGSELFLDAFQLCCWSHCSEAPPGSLSWGFSAPTPAPENSYTPVPVLLYSTGWLCGQGSLWLGTQHSFNKEYWMWHLTHSLVSVLHFLRNYVQWWPIGKPSGYLFWMIHNCFPMHRKDWTTEPLRFRGVARNRAGR